MRDIIKKVLREEFEEGLSRLITSYFKFLHRSKPKNVKELKDLMKDTLPMIQKSADDLPLYYQLYKANYRKDGRFDLITKDEFIGPEDLPARTISNTQASGFVRNKVPFKGSNLHGGWEKDRNGVKQYIVYSYGWYPIYIFKNDQWYGAANTYSSSTGRQMGNARPLEYNKDLGLKLLLLDKEEMELLKSGYDKERIIKKKQEKLTKSIPELSKRMKSFTTYTGDWYNKIKIKFRIIDAQQNENKVSLIIKVIDAFNTKEESPKLELTPQNKKIIERGIYNYIIGRYNSLVGSRLYSWSDEEEGEEDLDVSNLPKNLIFDMKFEY
jgi:hypothetical protein